MQDISLEETEQISLCEALDRVLNKGVVVAGEITISVANIDLIYLGLQLVLTSVETARDMETTNLYTASLMNMSKATQSTANGI